MVNREERGLSNRSTAYSLRDKPAEAAGKFRIKPKGRAAMKRDKRAEKQVVGWRGSTGSLEIQLGRESWEQPLRLRDWGWR